MKVLRILLVILFAAVCIVLAYRQSHRWKVGVTPVLVVNKEVLSKGSSIQVGDIQVRKLLNDEIPLNSLTNPAQVLNRQLASDKERGAVLTAQDLLPLPPRKPPVKMNALIPEGRLLTSLRVSRDSVVVEALVRGDRFDIVAMDGSGKPHVLARDAFYVGSLSTGAARSESEPQKIMGQEVPPPPGSKSQDPSYVVLKFALWPGDILPVASVNGSSARISLILHGKNEHENGEFLSILPPKKVKIKTPKPTPVNAKAELRKELRLIDPRINVEKVYVNNESKDTKSAYILTGAVKNMQRLQKAMLLTELFLGETGSAIRPLTDGSGIKATSNSFGNGGSGSIGASAPNLGAHLARSLILTNASKRVISFLEVDDLDQILVSIRVLEIDRKKADRKGINYRVDAEHFSIGQNLFQGGSLRNIPAVVGGNLGNIGNVAGTYVDSSVRVFAAIEYLEDSGVARSVAEPNILTISGEVASVLVGGSVPIPSSSLRDDDVFNSFDFREFGVELNIRPTLDEENVVTLEVAPRIVNIDNTLALGGVPGFETQEVRTVARVKESESLLLGGLLSYKETKDGRKIPFLGDIPLLGNLFRWDSRGFEEKELLFLITPVVATDGIEGLSRDVELPELNFRDSKLGDAPPPYGLNDEGLPLSWQEHYEFKDLQEMKTRKEGKDPTPDWQDQPTAPRKAVAPVEGEGETPPPMIFWKEEAVVPDEVVSGAKFQPADDSSSDASLFYWSEDSWFEAVRVEEETFVSQPTVEAPQAVEPVVVEETFVVEPAVEAPQVIEPAVEQVQEVVEPASEEPFITGSATEEILFFSPMTEVQAIEPTAAEASENQPAGF